MSIINRCLLPEGIEEILPPKAMQMEQLCRELIDLFLSWGYEFVIPPMIEYLESLLTATGADLDLKTFKITDQLNGRLMGIRADITPQIARIDSHLLKRDVPTRLCYLGSVLHTRANKSGQTRSPLQLGAELYGHAGIASDIEIVKLMLAALKCAGIEKVCIDLAHVGVFRSLGAVSSLDESQRKIVFDILQRKAVDELDAFYREQRISDERSLAFRELLKFNGDISVLKEARKLLGKMFKNVIPYIEELEILAKYIEGETGVLVNIDLAELRGYHYHTGIIYTAFALGEGEGIAFGGRYDNVGDAFGRARPATGFSTDVKSLKKFTGTPTTRAESIFAPASDDAALKKKVGALRQAGKIVIRELDGQQADAKAMGCEQQLVFENGEWIIKRI